MVQIFQKGVYKDMEGIEEKIEDLFNNHYFVINEFEVLLLTLPPV